MNIIKIHSLSASKNNKVHLFSKTIGFSRICQIKLFHIEQQKSIQFQFIVFLIWKSLSNHQRLHYSFIPHSPVRYPNIYYFLQTLLLFSPNSSDYPDQICCFQILQLQTLYQNFLFLFFHQIYFEFEYTSCIYFTKFLDILIHLLFRLYFFSS